MRQLIGRQNVQQNEPRGRQNIRPMNNTSWKIILNDIPEVDCHNFP